MGSGWLDIGTPAKRARLSWIGGGLVTLAAGAWAVVTYTWPPAHGGGGGSNCAQNASVATNGNVRGVTLNANGATVQAGGTTGCGSAAPAK